MSALSPCSYATRIDSMLTVCVASWRSAKDNGLIRTVTNLPAPVCTRTFLGFALPMMRNLPGTQCASTLRHAPSHAAGSSYHSSMRTGGSRSSRYPCGLRRSAPGDRQVERDHRAGERKNRIHVLVLPTARGPCTTIAGASTIRLLIPCSTILGRYPR